MEERVIKYIYNSLGLSQLYYIAAVTMFIILQWKWHNLSKSFLFTYLFLILSTTVLARQSIKTVTFDTTLLKFLLTDNEWIRNDYLRQMWANAIMFIPVGFLTLQLFRQEKEKRLPFKALAVCFTLVISLFFSVLIEYLQLRLKCGYSEADDIISNTIGATIGIVLNVIVWKVRRKHECRNIADS